MKIAVVQDPSPPTRLSGEGDHHRHDNGLHGGAGGGGTCDGLSSGSGQGLGISSMITSMKLTHESVPIKHSMVWLYIAALC